MILPENPTAEEYRDAAHYWQERTATLERELATAYAERDEARLRGDCLQTEITRWTTWHNGQPWLVEIDTLRSQLAAALNPPKP